LEKKINKLFKGYKFSNIMNYKIFDISSNKSNLIYNLSLNFFTIYGMYAFGKNYIYNNIKNLIKKEKSNLCICD